MKTSSQWIVTVTLVSLALGCSSDADSTDVDSTDPNSAGEMATLPSAASNMGSSDDDPLTTCEWLDSLEGFVVGTVEETEFVLAPFFYEQTSEALSQCDGLVEPGLRIGLRIEQVNKGTLDAGALHSVFVGAQQLRGWQPGLDYSADGGWHWADDEQRIQVGQRLGASLQWIEASSQWTLGGEGLMLITADNHVQVQGGAEGPIRSFHETSLADLDTVMGACSPGTTAGSERQSDLVAFLTQNATWVGGALCIPSFEHPDDNEGCYFDADCEVDEFCNDNEVCEVF